MNPLPLSRLLLDSGGELRGALPPETTFARLERDSRTSRPGDLFLAVQGERFDGHVFVEDAAARGATAALVRSTWADAHAVPPLPLVVVDEPVLALQRLAAARRARLTGLKVVGITGSVGKTSTKEVVAAVLGGRFQTYRNPGNLNTEIGLPLCLMELEEATEVAVLEMGGAYAFGELELLANIARPLVGVVTNVYPVHLERMGSLEAIAQTKAELVAALPAAGVAVLNGDDPRVRAMAGQTTAHVLTYGLGEDNDVRADLVQTEGLAGTTFRVHLDGESYHVKVPLIGSHAVHLALAGIAVGHALGMHISEMVPGFDDPAIQVRLLVLPGPNGSRLIDDTYNASTPSVMSALGLLQELEAERTIAVLGDMRELGPIAEEEHRIVGRRVAEVADVLVTYGDLARIIAAEAAETARVGGPDGPARDLAVVSFGLDQRTALIDYLRTELGPADTVLLKGSRGLEMENVVAALRADIGPRPSPSGESGANGMSLLAPWTPLGLPPAVSVMPTDPGENMAVSLALAGLAFVVTVILGRPVVTMLRKLKFGKEIRADGPQTHLVKRGTPTMGGLMICLTVVLVTLAFNLVGRLSMLLPVGVLLAAGVLGAADDLMTLVERDKEGRMPAPVRRLLQGGPFGMTARLKFIWLMGFALIAAVILYGPLGLHHIYVPFLGRYDIGLLYVPLAVFAIIGTSNGVNLTDGLDTLAPGTAAIAFCAYGIIAYVQGQLGVVTFCFTMVGALMGFLWFNAHPAEVIMGDTGSLALGAALATAAFMTGQWLLLPVVGFVFMLETTSVMMQVSWFKLTKRRTGAGRRLFKMTPLHHHFELSGWSETQVTMRFWMLGMMAGLIGVALALL